VLGLLAELPRKNCWTIAEHAGDRTPDGMQHLLSRARWDADGVRDDVRSYVVEQLGDPGAVLVVDLCRSWNYAEAPAACGECCWPWASEWGCGGGGPA
jgi:SRSO17 transposase